MLIVKYVRNWSYEIVEREVRADVVYRSFCRIGMAKVPDEKTLLRLGQAIGPDTAESNIHYPTDSGLLSDGARVLTRTMKQIEGKTASLKKKVRNRMRTVTKRVDRHRSCLAPPRSGRGAEAQKRISATATRDTANSQRFAQRVTEIEALPPRRRSGVPQLGERLETMAEQVRRVVRQTKARVFDGSTQLP